MLAVFMGRGRNETVPDQWQTQIFIRVLQKAKVIYVSQVAPRTVGDLHMIPASGLEEAKKIVGKGNPITTAIPNGVAVMVKEV